MNEEFVRRFVVEGEPIGRGLVTRSRRYVIVGVVRNSLSESFTEKPTPVMYFSYRDRPASMGQIHVRTRPGGESLLGPAIERVVHTLDPTLPVYDVRTLGEHVDKNLFLRRIPARMFVVLGPLMLVLAAIGIYAVVVVFGVAAHHRNRDPDGAWRHRPRVVRQIIGETLDRSRRRRIGGMATDVRRRPAPARRSRSTSRCSLAFRRCSCWSPPARAGCPPDARRLATWSWRSSTSDGTLVDSDTAPRTRAALGRR